MKVHNRKLLFVVNVDWFFLSHRLPIAIAAQKDGYEVHIATGLTDKLSELSSYGFIVHALDINRSSTGFVGIYSNLYQFWKIFKEVCPDIIHLVTIKPVLLGGIIARLVRLPAVVVAVSGLGFVFVDKGVKAIIRRWFVIQLYRLALEHRNIKVIFQNPDDLRSISASVRNLSGKVKIIKGSGVDIEKYTHSPLPEGIPVVVMASRLLADKGVREFVDAARMLRARSCNARFVLVGTVDLANPASLTPDEIEVWANEGVVECWGHRTDMPKVLSSAQIVVLPSYREGMPKVLLEAAACGRAVITTDVPGCRDAIEPNVTGQLVPVRNAAALADAIENLLGDPVRCQAWGTAGRKLAERAFDVRQVVVSHLRTYEELIETS